MSSALSWDGKMIGERNGWREKEREWLKSRVYNLENPYVVFCPLGECDRSKTVPYRPSMVDDKMRERGRLHFNFQVVMALVLSLL